MYIRIDYFYEHCFLHSTDIECEIYEDAEEIAREEVNIICANKGEEMLDIEEISFVIVDENGMEW